MQSKHKVVSIGTFDINGDGVPELITGWSTGKVDARTYNTGEVIFKIQLTSSVAGIVEADYRRTGKPDLVVVSVNGEGMNLIITVVWKIIIFVTTRNNNDYYLNFYFNCYFSMG